MKSVKYSIRTSFHQLWRGGQRNRVAFLCVVFGVMSLVSMTTLAQSIQQMLVLKPYELIGGDLTLDRPYENSISVDEETELQNLKADGTISDYTLMDYTTSLAFHFPDSGELIFPSFGMGIDPQKYPLAGNLTISEPQHTDLAHLLTNEGDIVITKDLAMNENLKVGDQIFLSDLNHGNSIPATVKGIASDTPNHQGSKIYFSHQTAQKLMVGTRTSNTVLVNSLDPQKAQKALEAQGWRVFTAQELANMTAASEGTLAMAVNDIGLLGLLVGGIGIANTMQVLLKRRRKEVAIWKSLGYTTRQIEDMFILEAGLLGAFGSLVGVGLGTLLSMFITGVFSRVTTILVIPHPSSFEAISGFVIGTLSTIVFALWAIVSTSQVTPSALLRQEAINNADLPKWKLVGLAALIGSAFIIFATWVLKSFLTGMLVFAASIICLWIIGLILLGLLRLVLKIFPMKRWPLAKIAHNNLRQRSNSLMVAMIALFIGVVMWSLGAVIIQSSENVITAVNSSTVSENLAIYTSPDQETNALNALSSVGLAGDSISHQYQVKQITIAGQLDDTAVIMSRAQPGIYNIQGQPWNSQVSAAYVPNYFDMKTGDPVQVTTQDGKQVNLTIAGTYSTEGSINWPGSFDDILVSTDIAKALGTPTSSQFFLTVDANALEKDADFLGKTLPMATIISMPDFQAHYVRQYDNLFWLVAVMAGLAILAGLLLVANSVNLTMLDRRYEIGVYKSLGYSRNQILFTEVLEYSLMSCIVALFGIGLTWLMMMLAKLTTGVIGKLLTLTPGLVLGIMLLTIGLTAFIVLASCWNPTKVSPTVTFNDRE
ncbi:MAG: FtsX-like permease family protein [Anaerolineaceae bacterium]